jgi:hypothetical protein
VVGGRQSEDYVASPIIRDTPRNEFSGTGWRQLSAIRVILRCANSLICGIRVGAVVDPRRQVEPRPYFVPCAGF